MKNLMVILRILTVVFLLGSFPVKSYWGQSPCDWMRIVGFVLLGICSIYALRKGSKGK